MLEGLVAGLLNQYLGKYIQNLNKENLNIGITQGSVELNDLQLKPEALFELDLPIEVKSGYVGRLSIDIPWTSLYASPWCCTLEDVYVLAGPISDRKYDPEKEHALEYAAKRKTLEVLDQLRIAPDGQATDSNQTFFQKLTTAVINNIQVKIQRIHIRYEDKVTNPDHPFACGIMLNEISIETTNSRWKSESVDDKSTTNHKLLQMHALSVYWNPCLPEQSLIRGKLHTSAWRTQLKNAINTHRIGDEDFEFFLRPMTIIARLVFNKDGDLQLPDVVVSMDVDELDVIISRQQFLSLLVIRESFQRMCVNQRYRKYHPGVLVKGNSRSWWKYAYEAVIQETIRPFSWQRIQMHRKKYKNYKNSYKKYLASNMKDKNLQVSLQNLENDLDISNIVMAREHAKLEFSNESPIQVEKRKQKKGWFQWPWFGSDDNSDEDEEIVLIGNYTSTNLPDWLNSLKPEEKKDLFNAIGYDQNQKFEHSSEFVAQKINFNLAAFTLSLVNYGKEILKVSLTQTTVSFENRPESDGLKILTKAKSFVVEGVSVEHDLVPIVTSVIGVYAPSVVNQVFVSLEFEKNPLHIESDFAAKLNIQPVEIVYDEHAVTEVCAFFQVPHISSKELKTMAWVGLSHITQISRAGLQYAIEQHKTLHLSVNMRSPYVVIPEYGTLHRGGNVVVIDFGKLKIESELQPKNTSLEDCTMSEIESRLYDKFIVTVTEVKVLLAESGEDWHTAQTNPDSEFHILPNFGMQLAFFNTVKSEYKQLPKHKIETKLSTLKINLSDEKHQMLADFCKHVPFPHSDSTICLIDSIDGHIESVSLMDLKEVQIPPSLDDLKRMKRAVRHNSVPKHRHETKNVDQVDNIGKQDFSPESQRYYSASDEEVEDWCRNLHLKTADDPASATNLIVVLARFVIGEVVLNFSRVEDKIEVPYLMLRFDRLFADTALTTYGMSVHAQIGGIQLADKIHLGASGEYLELFGFKTNSDFMSFEYNKVSPDCPDFATIYQSLQQGIVMQLSCLNITFDREAVLFLNSFIQGLVQSFHGNLQTSLRKSNSTILSGQSNVDPYQPEAPNFIDRLTTQNEKTAVPPSVKKLQVVLRLKDLNVLLCEHENKLMNVVVTEIESQLLVKGDKTTLKASLRDLKIEDRTKHTLYPVVFSLEDDNAFDIKIVTYHQSNARIPMERHNSVDGLFKLRVGRSKVVLLYKFISDLQNFLSPFANPELVESYKIAAQHAVYNKIQDMQEQGTRIKLNIDIHAPIVLLPQHAQSTNVILVKLGDLNLKNLFEETNIGQGIIQRWDHIRMNLDAMQVTRGKLNLNDNVEPLHMLVEPINLTLDLKRALPPHRSDVQYDIHGKLKNIKLQLTEQDLKVLLLVLNDNLFSEEVILKSDMLDYGNPVRPPSNGIRYGSADLTTPIVEIEEPLLMAPEALELVQQSKFSIDMEGLSLVLFTEEDPLATISPSQYDGEELASFSLDHLSFGGLLSNSGQMDMFLKLQSISLMDIRPNSNLAVKKLINSGVGEFSEYKICSPVIELVYKQTPEGSKQVEINIDTIRVNLCVQYLLTIFNFFAIPLGEFEKNSSPTVPSAVDIPNDMNQTMTSSQTSSSQALTISGRFKQLEVVLFAEPSQQNSRVLVLKTNASYIYTSLQNRQHTEARIKQLQVLSCVYGKVSTTSSTELYPCDIEFTCSRESIEKELKADIKVTDITAYISAATVHIVMDVYNILRQGIGPKKNLNPVCDTMSEAGHQCDLWTVKTVSADSWLDVGAALFELVELVPEHVDILPPSGIPTEILTIEAKKIQIVFELQQKNYFIPKLSIRSALNFEAHDWSKEMFVKGDLQLSVDYYNYKLATWEPIIEPVMQSEGCYRPWEVTFKLVRTQSYPISCASINPKLDKRDEVDGQFHDSWIKRRTKSEAESSETETDSETEMTVIKPKTKRNAHLGSHGSYDSASHHSSIQGESDSESESTSNISNQLQSLLSSDSSDADAGDDDMDAFEASDQPVFLTSKGPISVIKDSSSDIDEVDSVAAEQTPDALCNYLVISCRDQLPISLTSGAITVLSEIYDALEKPDSTLLMSIHDLPPFEIYNQLGVPVVMTASADLKIFEDEVHNVTMASECEKSVVFDEVDSVKLVDIDNDEVDGIKHLCKALTKMSSQMVNMTMKLSTISVENDGKERLDVKVEGFEQLGGISCKRSVRRLLQLVPTKNNTDYCMVLDVDVVRGHRVVTLQSPLRIMNNLAMTIQISCDTDELHKFDVDIISKDDQQFTQICSIEPGKTYTVPLYIAYHCRLYVTPANMLYEKSTTPIWWQEFGVNKDNHKYFSCQPQTPNNNVFHFKVQWEEDLAIKKSPALPRLVPNCMLHICASAILHNLLPYNIHYSIEGSALHQLSPGDNIPLFTADFAKSPKLQLQAMNYLGLDWTGSVDLTNDLEEFKAINMEADCNIDSQNKQLSLSIHVNQRLSMDLFIYSPYWIINKTGLPVQIRGSRSEAVYENDESDTILFRFKKHRRKKAKLRVYNSKWTQSFCLDTVGSTGLVICYDRERNRKYQFLLKIEMSRLNLTKIVTILPYFLVVNDTTYSLRYMEDNEQADLWIDISPNECSPFWPVTDSLRMFIKHKDSVHCSCYFPFNLSHKTVLRMDKGTALCVEVSVTELSIIIRVLPFCKGDAPVQVVNLCDDVFLKLHQKKQSQVTLLSPNQSVLYTWDDPTEERTLMWNVYNRKKPSSPAFINKDGSGEAQLSIQTVRRSSVLMSASKKSLHDDRKNRLERHDKVQDDSSPDDDSDVDVGTKQSKTHFRQNTRTDKVTVYWVSYLDGIQRVLLLTQDERIAKKAIQKNDAEKATFALFLSMAGVSLSLVNSLYEEVAYVSLNSSSARWEVEIKNKWKLLPVELASWLETHFNTQEKKVILGDVETDLVKMEMQKPYQGALRRTYNPAVWIQYRCSKHHTQLSTKIHWLQVDNQLNDAYFLTAFSPYRTPAYVVKKSGPKPFFELSLLRRKIPEYNFETFKYVKCLIQEFNIRLDKGFILSLYDMYASHTAPINEGILLGQDVAEASCSLSDMIRSQNTNRMSRCLVEHIHLSPLKMHVSLSLDGRPHLSSVNNRLSGLMGIMSPMTADIVDFYLNSTGAKLAETNDIQLRIALFQRENITISYQKLMSEIVSHYKTQIIQQSYVLLLGLDVLGNPYGLVKDFTQGLGEFFYEPILGSVQQPDKYADNLFQGIRNLLRHTFGGISNPISRITASIGKTLAILSFDEDHIRNRQRVFNRQHDLKLPDTLILASQSFSTGVVFGISGVFLQPMKGCKDEGAEGFFKGLGKGLLGLFTKPCGGVIDMVSLAVDGLRRTAEMGEDIAIRMRLPRYIFPAHGLKPFSTYHAIGMKILHSVDRGSFINSDIYWAHAALTRDERPDILLITDRQVMLLKKCKSWSEWSVDWKIPLCMLFGSPIAGDKKLIIRLKRNNIEFGWFAGDEKEILITDQELVHWLQKQFEEILNWQQTESLKSV